MQGMEIGTSGAVRSRITGVGDKPQIAQISQMAEAKEFTADGRKIPLEQESRENDRGLASSNLCHL